jgi:cytoskeletal protein CcmA (bactofilin family)
MAVWNRLHLGGIMRVLTGLPRLACGGLLLYLTFSLSAYAENSRERTQFGHNITIGPDEEVSEATCFGCSIRVQGHVSGDVTTFGGSVLLENQAEVGGDTTTFAGDIRLDKDAAVRGDVTVFGGRLRRDSQSSVGGDVTNMSGPGWILLIFVLPLIVLGGILALIAWLIWRVVRRRASPAIA